MATLVIRNFIAKQVGIKRDYPWRRLYRVEEGAFACLPWDTRGLASLLIKVCDVNGRIECPEEPRVSIGKLIRASAGERRYLDKHIDALVACGFMQWETGDAPTATAPPKAPEPPQPEDSKSGATRELTGTYPGATRELLGTKPDPNRDLFGTKVETTSRNPSATKRLIRRKNKESEDKISDPRVRPVLDVFDRRHRMATNVPPPPKEFGRLGKLVAKMQPEFTAELVGGLVNDFFDGKSEWARGKGYGVGVFEQAMSELIRLRSPSASSSSPVARAPFPDRYANLPRPAKVPA